jgi:uncharacterized lipoprotein YmbA
MPVPQLEGRMRLIIFASVLLLAACGTVRQPDQYASLPSVTASSALQVMAYPPEVDRERF